jgi:Putative peptidoglycan binding domain
MSDVRTTVPSWSLIGSDHSDRRTASSDAHIARHEDHFRHDRHFFIGDPFGYGYPYYGYDYPYYGYYDDNGGDYSDGQSSPAEVTPSQETIIAVQKELTQLGYYHGRVDGLMDPQTERAIRWFQSVDKLPVTGQIDDATLNALRIS